MPENITHTVHTAQPRPGTPVRRANRGLLTVHVASSVAVLGAELVLAALGVAGARGTDPRQVYPAAALVGQWLVAPLALVALASGLLLVRTTGWSPLRDRWVGVKLAITAVLTVLVFTVLVPRLGAVAQAATGVSGSVTGAERIRLAIIPVLGAALLLLNTALGVSKPGRRRSRTAG